MHIYIYVYIYTSVSFCKTTKNNQTEGSVKALLQAFKM